MEIADPHSEKSGRIALITGSAKGLGREIALHLAEDAAAIAVHYKQSRKDAEEVVDAVRRKGAECAAFAADLSDENEAKGLVRSVEEMFGRVDILVNNVGPFLVKSWKDLTRTDLDAMFHGVFGSALFCLQAVLGGMREKKWGRIVNIGYSRAEQLGAFPNITAYAAAKTGLLILTRTAAVAEVAHGITVNMVSPGLIEGSVLPPVKTLRPEAIGKAKDVAGAVRYLASDAAGAVTGTNIIVAGTWKM